MWVNQYRFILKVISKKIPENEIEDVLTKTKKIQQLGYQINKAL